jgi:hypothetical protein
MSPPTDAHAPRVPRAHGRGARSLQGHEKPLAEGVPRLMRTVESMLEGQSVSA